MIAALSPFTPKSTSFCPGGVGQKISCSSEQTIPTTFLQPTSIRCSREVACRTRGCGIAIWLRCLHADPNKAKGFEEGLCPSPKPTHLKLRG